ncbi:MAG: DNA cytosine methyltransferase [Bradyrhizobium sp.]|nr:DNA cytosine methyltransferase [Bradyrhizobium sp.]
MARVIPLLDVFSGIGGFSLGLERTGGFRTIGFCEIEPFCRRVLAKHWPDVPIFPDIRELDARTWRASGLEQPRAICGGFPCQDISAAGAGAGIDGPRSGLWREMARLVGVFRPGVVFVENVPALRSRGLGRVLGDLATLGYDAEWHCIPAAALGAPHGRDRIWVLAYPDGTRKHESAGRERESRLGTWCSGESVAYPGGARLSPPERETVCSPGRWQERRAASERGGWPSESGLVRMAHGVPGRVDRIAALGNAIVPQAAEAIGRMYLDSFTLA